MGVSVGHFVCRHEIVRTCVISFLLASGLSCGIIHQSIFRAFVGPIDCVAVIDLRDPADYFHWRLHYSCVRIGHDLQPSLYVRVNVEVFFQY